MVVILSVCSVWWLWKPDQTMTLGRQLNEREVIEKDIVFLSPLQKLVQCGGAGRAEAVC